MNVGTIALYYESTAGKSEIRTINRGDEILFSLSDVVRTIAAENRAINPSSQTRAFNGLLTAHAQALEADELYSIIDNSINESYVTQAGLFRVILRDSSPACRKFQKWVLNEVLPSIQKYGSYPPPEKNNDSEIKQLVKLLLCEIEAREKSEREIKEKFVEHDNKLKLLSDELENVTSTIESEKFHSVYEWNEISSLNLSESELQLFFGWCVNICATESLPSKKLAEDKKFDRAFSKYVLNNAMEKSLAKRK
ncbi:Bro-N domain-containing protein [Pectobacterium parvum]|uniref:BRO-N domain-containing protein n=1 Tax=Pectobacterium TaxID=122277 RepID=UPI002B24DA8F|nr:BRO family protein [Pectobacterium carotovorum]